MAARSTAGVDAILRRIISHSETYLTKTPHLPQRIVEARATPCIRFSLPDPPPLSPVILASGASPEVVREMDSVYLLNASAFRQRTTDVIQNALLALASSSVGSENNSRESQTRLVEVMTQVYVSTLKKWVQECQSYVKTNVAATSSPHESRQQDGRSTFNHDYVPLLEHFFEENSFPTHADKVFLARKSGMTYRQIHVWFQNRRNRTRKNTDGKVVLRKKPISEGATIAMDNLLHRMRSYLKPKDHQITVPRHNSDSAESKQELIPSSTQHDFLSNTSPPHAFPTVYPPKCSYDPFPINSGPSFNIRAWPRTPSSTRIIKSTVPDVDALTEMFAQLNVREDRSNHRKQSRSGHDSSAATCSITTRPSPAPHPAFIPQPISSRVDIVCRLNAVPAPPSRLRIFETHGSQMGKTSLVPSTATSLGSSSRAPKRKISPLPKRIPQSATMVYRGFTPSTSECSLSSLPSRSSSWNTDDDTLFNSILPCSSSASPSPPSSPISSATLDPKSLLRPSPETVFSLGTSMRSYQCSLQLLRSGDISRSASTPLAAQVLS